MKLLEPYTDGGQFDVVVIGSGFGGSVVGLPVRRGGPVGAGARAGPAVPARLVPAEPQGHASAASGTPSGTSTACSTSGTSKTSKRVVSSGLGGGSLIYANVLLRKDEHWFTQDIPGGSGQEQWAVTRADLDPLLRLRRAHAAGPDACPFGANGYQLRKTAAPSRRRRPARQGLEPRAPRRPVPQRPPAAGAGRAAGRGAVRQPLRAAPAHLPALRRVRHRLQRRRQEHPRPHLPVEGRTHAGARPQPAERGEGARRATAITSSCATSSTSLLPTPTPSASPSPGRSDARCGRTRSWWRPAPSAAPSCC